MGRVAFTQMQTIKVVQWMTENKDAVAKMTDPLLGDRMTEALGFRVTRNNARGMRTRLGFKRIAKAVDEAHELSLAVVTLAVAIVDCIPAAIDPGEGYRLLDPEKDERRVGDDFLNDNGSWQTIEHGERTRLYSDITYRRKVEPEPPTLADLAARLAVLEHRHAIR